MGNFAPCDSHKIIMSFSECQGCKKPRILTFKGVIACSGKTVIIKLNMHPEGRLSIWVRILLPLLVLPLLSIAPRPHRLVNDLTEARQAMSAGPHRLAAARLADALAVEPQRVDLFELIARESLAAGDTALALSAYESARRGGHLSLDGWLQLGDIYLRQGQGSPAVGAWQGALSQYGPSSLIYERLFRYQRAGGDLASAAATLQAWAGVDPRNAQVLFLYGEFLAVSAPDQSLQQLLSASQLDSSYSSRVQELRKGLALASTSSSAGYGWVIIGRSLASSGEWDLAEAAFEKATVSEPGYAEGWAFLGEARQQLKRGGKAELDKAISLAPDSILVHGLMALYWRRNGEPDRALKDLEAMIAQEPQEPAWRIELGNIWVDKGDLNTARSCFEQAVQAAPDSVYPLKALAQFSIVNNVDIRNLGLPAARKAVLMNGSDAEALDLMGLALISLDDYSTAERFLQRALQNDPFLAAAYLHLGQVYLQQDDPMKAHDFLTRASDLGKDEAVGLLARRLLKRYYNEGG